MCRGVIRRDVAISEHPTKLAIHGKTNGATAIAHLQRMLLGRPALRAGRPRGLRVGGCRLCRSCERPRTHALFEGLPTGFRVMI